MLSAHLAVTHPSTTLVVHCVGMSPSEHDEVQRRRNALDLVNKGLPDDPAAPTDASHITDADAQDVLDVIWEVSTGFKPCLVPRM